MTVPSVIDVYSGCGGFALGAELAGFEVTDSVEIDLDLHSSHRLNFPNTRRHLRDVRTADAAHWKSTRGESPSPDGLIGGPPCQGFSVIGKRDVADERNELVGVFFDQVLLLKPKFFVMENVRGLLSDRSGALARGLDRVSSRYAILGPLLLTASDFGLPTNRKRVFVVGVDTERMESIDEAELLAGSHVAITVKDAISDLPPARSKARKNEYDWSRYRREDDELRLGYARSMRSSPSERLGWERAKRSLAEGRVSGNQMTTHTPKVIARFQDTPHGKRDPISRFPRLDPDGLCPTLRAGTGAEKGSFQSMRPIHPTNPRVITVREAARLQGFPDWFVFHPTIWHSFRMIGNSVPPPLSQHLLSKLKSKL